MFHLSETDRVKAKAGALRTLTINANSTLPDRLSPREERKGNFGLDVDRMGARNIPGCRAEPDKQAFKALQKRHFFGRIRRIPVHVGPRRG